MVNEKDNLLQIKRLSSDEKYFNNVFKKTEKLVSVTFYILSNTDKKDRSETHLDLIKDKALKTHEMSLKTLTLQSHEQTAGLTTFQYELLAFDSTLRVAEAAGVIPKEVSTLLLDQVDGIQRYINNHYNIDAGYSLGSGSTAQKIASTTTKSKKRSSSPNRNARVQIPAGDISTDAYLVYSQLTDRAERIKTVLEAKPQATIKDIAEVVTDVSEKTIQRELNSLIEKGQVIREGERRWSRYSVAK